ncbi:MAG TPA: SDR family oxidoreductase [Gemmatimonadaceae bacterium]|nr:SDR family oxidoreductase [Gemmatimonadaceae bacterium]
MNLLIFGASGHTGRHVIREALARGHRVSAFARDPEKLGDFGAALSLIRGDVGDATAVAQAVPGHDAVVSTLGVGTPLRHDPKVIAGIEHILAAMQVAKLKRLIYQSFIGVEDSRAAVGFVLRFIAPLPLRHEIADHEVKEALIKASATDWTIVRPPKLTNGPRTTYRVGLDITTRVPVPTLSRASVAHFIVNELEAPQYIRKVARLLR